MSSLGKQQQEFEEQECGPHLSVLGAAMFRPLTGKPPMGCLSAGPLGRGEETAQALDTRTAGVENPRRAGYRSLVFTNSTSLLLREVRDLTCFLPK